MRVWDLCLLRNELARMGLDWDALPYASAAAGEPRALKAELQLVDPIEQAAREQEKQGNKHRVAKEYAEAIACYREVIRSEPSNAALLRTVAWLLAIGPPEVRDGPEALKLMERASAWEPQNRWVDNTLGAAQYRAGQHAEALRSLRQAEKKLQSHEDFPWPHNWLPQALCLAELGQHDAARELYEKSVAWLEGASYFQSAVS